MSRGSEMSSFSSTRFQVKSSIATNAVSNWSELSAMSFGAVIEWASRQSWAVEMAECAQDSQWHAEGDVWTHTVRVCDVLQAGEHWRHLESPAQRLLLFSALLHDVAKPRTTSRDSITGRIQSPKHAVKGEAMARAILASIDCPFRQRESICALVRNHGAPVHIFSRPDPEIEMTRLSWLLRNDWLYQLALADLRGRDSRESNRSEDDLKLFLELARETGCVNSEYPFANDAARFLAGCRELSSLHYVPHQEFRCEAIVMSGMPASGKDTWIQQNLKGSAVVSLDQIRQTEKIDPGKNQGRVIQKAREQCREHLRTGEDFVINATNTTRQIRRQWIDLCTSYDARVTVIYLEPPLET